METADATVASAYRQDRLLEAIGRDETDTNDVRIDPVVLHFVGVPEP